MTNDEFKKAITETINQVNDIIILKRIYIFVISIIG